MNKWLYIISLGLIITNYVNVLAADKIAVVNVSSIFQQYPQLDIVAKQLENEFRGRATELQSMERDLQTNIQKLQRDSSTMKASERFELEQLLNTQREAFSNKARIFEQDNHRRQTEEHNKIMSCIQDAVKYVALKKGFDIVIDTNVVAYASKDKDISDDVLKQVK